jgi:hypothetical protein
MFLRFRQLKTIWGIVHLAAYKPIVEDLKLWEQTQNPMVYRWLVDVQEYDFTLEDIQGLQQNPAGGWNFV